MYTTQSSGYGFTVPARRPVPGYTTETGHTESRPNWALVGLTAKKRRAYHKPRLVCTDDTSTYEVPNVLKGLVR